MFVNTGSGAGYVNAPNGTVVTFAFVGAHVGSFTGRNTCTIANGLGTCTVDTTSADAGTTHQASTTLSVGGSLTRTTGQGTVGHVNGDNATKTVGGRRPSRTDIHDAAHAVITTATAGEVVHDKVFVTRAAGTPAAVPNPTGNVVFHRYTTIDCTGAAVDETVALAADGTAESSTFTVAGDMSYKRRLQR